MADLIISSGEASERTIELGERLSIGRAPSNELVIDDPKASRRHAEIRHLGGGRYRIMDVGSANGTWLNGRRVAVPRELENGDVIVIAGLELRFVATPVSPREEPRSLSGTALTLEKVQVVVLVADIRNFTTMTEALPGGYFSRLISDWFRECTEIIEKHGGTVDKFIGDAVLAYWVSLPQGPGLRERIRETLAAALDLTTRASAFSASLRRAYPEHSFRIGVGLNTGEASFGNVGTNQVQSFTIVGDTVNVAFRLEELTKQMDRPIVVSAPLVDGSDVEFEFTDLGLATVRGRKEPVHIYGLTVNSEMTS